MPSTLGSVDTACSVDALLQMRIKDHGKPFIATSHLETLASSKEVLLLFVVDSNMVAHVRQGHSIDAERFF